MATKTSVEEGHSSLLYQPEPLLCYVSSMHLAYLSTSLEGALASLWLVNLLFVKQNLISENMLNWEVERNEMYKWITICGLNKAIFLPLRQNYSGLTWLSGSLNLKKHQCPSLMISVWHCTSWTLLFLWENPTLSAPWGQSYLDLRSFSLSPLLES